MIATAVLAADYAATLDLSDHTETRARTTQQISAPADQPIPPQTTPLGVDAYTLVQARLHVDDRIWEWLVVYAPSLLLLDLEQGVAPQVYQVGGTSIAWHDRRVQLTVGEDASYGLLNSASLPPAQVVPGQPPTVQPAAEPATLLLESSRSYATVAVRATRRASWTLGVEYLLSGGADAASRAVMPFQTGPRAWGSLDYDLARTDHMTTYASIQRADFSTAPCVAAPGQTLAPGMQCAPQDVLGTAEETITHKMSRTVTLALGAGGAAASNRLSESSPSSTTLFPVADVSLQVHFARDTSLFAIYGRLAPYVNMLDGLVANNLIGEASLRNALTQRVALRVAVGGAQALPTDAPAATSLVRGEVEVDYTATRWIDLALGERGFWQEVLGSGAFVSTFGFVGVTVREPTLHF